MTISPFHAYYETIELTALKHSGDKLIVAFASSDIEIYPYQISAAMFALRSPYLPCSILCDDRTLGKPYEAMLVISQK